jgi:hypothetical protein
MYFSRQVIIMTGHEVWFSHREKIYEVKHGRFVWTDKNKIWNWDHCTVQLVRTSEKNLMVVIRSKANKNSKRMGNRPIKLRFMLGFDINDAGEPKIQMPDRNWNGPNDGDYWQGAETRWVFFLAAKDDKNEPIDADYYIWEPARKGEKIESSYIYKLYKEILANLSSKTVSDNIFNVGDVESGGYETNMIPVIYQPAVDSMKNFLRQVHCNKKPLKDGGYEVEVTLIFNNEQLRKHYFLQKSYEWLREKVLYGRKQDIETFRILAGRDPKHFVFERIYSKKKGKEYGLEDDNIHGDKIAEEHHIKYYFMNQQHPVVFVNTSNHALAEDDANPRLWKWEYVPWENDGPVVCDTKSRKDIDKEVKSKFRFW